MDELGKNIFKTIAWFDIFDYPLTAWEAYKWFFQSSNLNFSTPKLEEIKEQLEKSEELKKLISYKYGFYFLKWRDDLIRIRKQRYLIAEKKYQKLLKIAKFLALLPFIRLIAVANGLSYSNAKEEDDLDLFIITTKNRIWLTRFFSILILKIFKARPTLADKKDKICLNFFITEDSLNLENIMLEEKNDLPDIYFIYWLAWLYPIYDDGIWERFVEKNQWIKKYLPNHFPQEPIVRRKIILKPFSRFFKKFCEKIHSGSFNGLSEKFYRWLQLKIIPKHLKEMANKSTSVIINDKILKFHDKDKREEYRKKFYEKVIRSYC
ncbi:MAG: hypothetical protein N2259_00525 [Patescibacteria group bacterium]|nr:hypothetical protein [Patescibacteria group bacterium]